MSATQANEKQIEWLVQCLKPIVVQQLGLTEDDIEPTTTFVDDLGADSLDNVELILAVEDEFDIRVEDHEADKITCIQDAIPVLHPILMESSQGYKALA